MGAFIVETFNEKKENVMSRCDLVHDLLHDVKDKICKLSSLYGSRQS